MGGIIGASPCDKCTNEQTDGRTDAQREMKGQLATTLPNDKTPCLCVSIVINALKILILQGVVNKIKYF